MKNNNGKIGKTIATALALSFAFSAVGCNKVNSPTNSLYREYKFPRPFCNTNMKAVRWFFRLFT